MRKKVDDVIDKFAQHGLRSIGVATQVLIYFTGYLYCFPLCYAH